MPLPKKNIPLVFALLGALAAAGLFFFWSWQNKQTVVEHSPNSNAAVVSNTNQAAPRPTLKHSTPDTVTIPDRKIDAPIVYVDAVDEPTFQEALGRGVVHYPGTALPGELGNPYIFGHSSDYGWKPGDYKRVFTPLVDIPVGTLVRITDHDGDLFIYKIIETKIVGPKDVTVLDQQNYERRLLTLQTSWPVGTALKRFVAVAELDEQATYGPAPAP